MHPSPALFDLRHGAALGEVVGASASVPAHVGHHSQGTKLRLLRSDVHHVFQLREGEGKQVVGRPGRRFARGRVCEVMRPLYV